MRYFSGLLICQLLFYQGVAQFNTDSLLVLLPKAKEDTNKVYLLQNIASAYSFDKPDSSLYYAEQALEVSQRIKFPKGEMMSRGLVAGLFAMNGNYSKSMELSLKNLQMAEKIGDTEEIMINTAAIADAYMTAREFEHALNYINKSRAIINSGFFNDSLREFNYLNAVIVPLGNLYQNLNKMDSALYYRQRAYEHFIRNNNDNELTMANTGMGDMQASLGNYDVALSYYRLSIYHAERSMSFDFEGVNFLSIADIFAIRGQLDSAIHYANRGYRLLESLGKFKYMSEGAGLLANLYEKEKKYDSSVKYLRLSITHNDSLKKEDRIKEFMQLSFNEMLRQQEIARDQARIAEERVENLRLLAIAIFIPAFFLSVLLLGRRKVNIRVINFLGVLSVLLVFEFISILLHPLIERITHHNTILMLLILVCIASVLVPMHHYVEKWLKKKLASRIKMTPDPEPDPETMEQEGNTSGIELAAE